MIVENLESALKPGYQSLNGINNESLNQEEIDNFTTKVTSFFANTNFFNWLLNNTHGIHESTGMPDYNVWWDDVQAIKQGSKVTFKHMTGGGGHNILIPTGQLLSQALTGYLLTGDTVLAKLTEQLCKGVTALMQGMHWSDNDPAPYLMARNIIPCNHDHEVNNGIKAINYDNWRNHLRTWNTERLRNPTNPYWGDIYVTAVRSKDGLPHLFRAAAYLPNLTSDYGSVSKAGITLYNHLRGFCNDIIENNYHIRAKSTNGTPYIPKGDLTSFISYGKKAEANARLVISLIGKSLSDGINCGNGINYFYDTIATRNHYYNHKIINGFHMDAVLHSLVNGDNELANRLLNGLKKRINRLSSNNHYKKNPRWKPDMAVLLLQSASIGLPLTKQQVQLIHNEYSKAISAYENFKLWDLWDNAVPDGLYNYKPNSEGLVKPEELGHLLEYSYSPYKSPLSEPLINPRLMSNIQKW